MEAYGYLKDGEIVAPVAMCSRFNDIGAWHTLTNEERSEHGWYPCKIVQADFNPKTQYTGSSVLTFSEGTIVCTIPVFDKPLETVRQEMIESLNSSVQDFKNIKVSYENLEFRISDIVRLCTLMTVPAEFLFIEYKNNVIKVRPEQVSEIVDRLLAFEQKILAVQYFLSERINKSTSIEDVISIDIHLQLLSILEN